MANATEYDEVLGTESFRLLYIESANPEQGGALNLRCRLVLYKIEQAPPYAALSYAWTEPQASLRQVEELHHIFVNDQETQVTSNLYRALLEIVRQKSTQTLRYIWIDAICINQNSIAERTAQVSVMHRIYSNADAVFVWLGPDLENEARSIREFFRALLAKYWHEEDYTDEKFTARRYARDFLYLNYNHAFRNAGLPPFQSRIWHLVVNFWERRYWSRTWVLQEVALAQRVSFWCGDIEFSQAEIKATSSFFLASGLSKSLMRLHLPEEDGYEQSTVSGGISKVGENAAMLQSLQHLTKTYTFTEGLDYKQAADRLTGPLKDSPSGAVEELLLRTFAVQLSMTFARRCTDPRDRVFATLVLLEQVALNRCLAPIPLKVDYSKSIAAVFTEATGWIIERTGWLGMLSLLHPQREELEVKDLPSWVPDFDAFWADPLLVFDPGMHERMDRKFCLMTEDIRPAVRGAEILVSARRIGRVRDVGDALVSIIGQGLFEATASLLLEFPETICSEGYTRIDYWIDAILLRASPSQPSDALRAGLKYYLEDRILRTMTRDLRQGRITRESDHLEKMPNLFRLADCDSTGSLTKIDDWIHGYKDVENHRRLLGHSPPGQVWLLPSRRILSLANLVSSGCPDDALLGVGPEAVVPGDEIFDVVGSTMPLILRPEQTIDSHGQRTARVVGEASITFLDGTDQMPEQGNYERWTLI